MNRSDIRTIQHLEAAFAGESMAHIRYRMLHPAAACGRPGAPGARDPILIDGLRIGFARAKPTRAA